MVVVVVVVVSVVVVGHSDDTVRDQLGYSGIQ